MASSAKELRPGQDCDLAPACTEKAEEVVPVAPTQAVPPDGGTQAWLAVLGGFLCQFCSFGFINALGIFQFQYEEVILTTYSSSSISWILTFQLFLMFFLSQAVGLLVDMYGPRPVMIPASVLVVLGVLTLSFCTEYWQIFLAQSVCFGVGAAGVFMPGLVVAGQYFHQKRALAVGVVASGSSLGGVVFPIFLTTLFDRIGFAPTLRWTALMLGILLVAANLLISPLHKPKGWQGKRSIASLAAFRSPPFLLYVSGAFLFFWGVFGPFNFMALFASQSEDSAKIALYLVSITNAASIPGRVLPSHIADRLGHFAVMTTMAYASGILVLGIWLPLNYHRSMAGLIIFTLGFGFASGAFVSLMTPCVVDLCDGKTENLGVMLGSTMNVVAFAFVLPFPAISFPSMTMGPS
ncbi:MAG: hypothetical protein M1838_000225 [Thelocarpon superellum]|nr:MAG: hypothetical protein M1838_000225 [Thelocarpon superellum]